MEKKLKIYKKRAGTVILASALFYSQRFHQECSTRKRRQRNRGTRRQPLILWTAGIML